MLTLDQACGAAHEVLVLTERSVADLVAQRLKGRTAGASADDDDTIFEPYAAYVRLACQLLWPLRAPNLWFSDIEPAVRDYESANGHVHKGAPLYNTGLCFFRAGDFARASQYIGVAGEEDEQAGRGPAANLLVAEGFSETLLLGPFYNWAQDTFGTDYQAAVGASLDKVEVRELVRHVALRVSDAVLMLAAIHRLSAQVAGPESDSTRVARTRALADLVLVFESGLRRWQPAGIGALHARSAALLDQNPIARAAFDQSSTSYHGQDKESPHAVNTMVTQELVRFDGATSTAERAGIAVFVAYRLRNSLMHVVEEQVVFFHDSELLSRLFGLALVAVRISRHGEENTLANL